METSQLSQSAGLVGVYFILYILYIRESFLISFAWELSPRFFRSQFGTIS